MTIRYSKLISQRTFGLVGFASLITTGASLGCGASDELAVEQDGIVDEVASELAGSSVQCVTIRRGTFGTVSDTYVNRGAPSTNYGSSQTADISGQSLAQKYGLVRFDLSAIPANATITSASLKLTQSNTGAATLEARPLTVAPWNEATLTYSSYVGAYRTPAILASNASPVVNFDAKSAVQNWVSGAVANNGFTVLQAATTLTRFATSENATVSQRPALDVCFEAVAPAGYANCDGNILNGFEVSPCGNGGLCSVNADCASDVCQAGVCVAPAPAAVCGDGIVNQGAGVEECDDGNAIDGDACSNACQRPTCEYQDGSQHPAVLGMAANLGGGQSLATSMSNSAVPGLSIAIRDSQGNIYAATFGNSYNQAFDPSAPPLSPNTLFQAGSVSKAITALAYLKSGLAGPTLNKDIRPVIAPWIVPPYSITPAELLTHSAGTAPHGFTVGYWDGQLLPNAQQVVLGQSPASGPAVTFDASKRFIYSYSGGGYMLGQAWLEQVSGKGLDAFARDNLFVESGAKRTSYQQPLPASEHDAACGRAPELALAGKCRKAYGELAAAGLWSTPTDLACIAGNVTTNHQNVLATVASKSLSIGATPWKMGVGLFHRTANGVDESAGHMYEHSGANPGFRTEMLFFSDGRAIVAMDNASTAKGGIAHFATRALCRELGWPCSGVGLTQ